MNTKVEIKLDGMDTLENLIKENEKILFELNRNIEEINHTKIYINAQIKAGSKADRD